jgi:hypothetical protein
MVISMRSPDTAVPGTGQSGALPRQLAVVTDRMTVGVLFIGWCIANPRVVTRAVPKSPFTAL